MLYDMRPCAAVCKQHALHIKRAATVDITHADHFSGAIIDAPQNAQHGLGAAMGGHYPGQSRRKSGRNELVRCNEIRFSAVSSDAQPARLEHNHYLGGATVAT